MPAQIAGDLININCINAFVSVTSQTIMMFEVNESTVVTSWRPVLRRGFNGL